MTDDEIIANLLDMQQDIPWSYTWWMRMAGEELMITPYSEHFSRDLRMAMKNWMIEYYS